MEPRRREYETAVTGAALVGAVEYREDRLHANTLPIDAITRDFALLTDRGLCEVLADFMTSRGHPCEYTDLYSVTRGEEPEDSRMDRIGAACQDEGVTAFTRDDGLPADRARGAEDAHALAGSGVHGHSEFIASASGNTGRDVFRVVVGEARTPLRFTFILPRINLVQGLPVRGGLGAMSARGMPRSPRQVADWRCRRRCRST